MVKTFNERQMNKTSIEPPQKPKHLQQRVSDILNITTYLSV